MTNKLIDRLKAAGKQLFRRAGTSVLGPVDQILDSDYRIRWHNCLLGFHSPSYSFKHDEIAFIHIPKTAGTTICAVLEEMAPSRFVGLGMHRPVSKNCSVREFDYVTFLRQPVDRVWSYFRMARRDRNNPYHEYASKDLRCFLDHCWEARNMVCRYLLSDIYRDVNGLGAERAKQKLSSFYFVGLFEELHHDVEHLVKLLGENTENVSLPHLRESKKVHASREDRKMISLYNQYDIALYDWYVSQRRRS